MFGRSEKWFEFCDYHDENIGQKLSVTLQSSDESAGEV
jgi:hypothetical protein